jgi:1,2-diacylglycerol-3-alpha-glucose alpha-1,2-galactosyltransferase
MRVNFFVEDMLFFKYIGCATAARSLFSTMKDRSDIEISYNGRERNYDLTHYHTFGPLALYNKKQRREIAVLTAHSTPRVNENNVAFSRTVNRQYPKIYSGFDHIITISDSCHAEIASMIPDVSATLIPNGVDRSFFRHDPELRATFRERYRIPADRKVVLTVAQQTPRKGIYDVMELAREDPETVFVWVGGFPYGVGSKEYFRIRRLKQRCGENMIFTGFVPDIREVYSGADIFFMPSYAETFGLVVLEALSSGLPVVARDIPEFREIFGDTISYFRNRAEAAHRTRDDEALEALRKIARKSTERFDINLIADMHLKLYRELVDS